MMKNPSLGLIVSKNLTPDKAALKNLTHGQKKVLLDIACCHTPAAGSMTRLCDHCGTVEHGYCSCGNSACPQCGSVRREEWLKKQRQKAVEAPCFHLIFTVPDKELNRLFLHDQRFMYNLLLQAQAEAIRTVLADPKYFGVEKTGFTSVLHTWGSTMNYHPHVHTVLYGAGLDEKGNLRMKKGEYLCPAKKLAQVFKDIFLRKLCQRYEKSESPWLDDLQTAKKIQWNVEIRYFGKDPEKVIEYLGRYINRTAITNNRLISYEDRKVTFTYKDYRDGGKRKEMTLDENEFIRRFCLHILPRRFIKCRRYGYMGNNSSKLLEVIQQLADQEKDTVSTTGRKRKGEKDRDFRKCPKCGNRMRVRRSGYREKKWKQEDMAAIAFAFKTADTC